MAKKRKKGVGSDYERIITQLELKKKTIKGFESVDVIQSEKGKALYVEYGPEHESDIGKLETHLVSVFGMVGVPKGGVITIGARTEKKNVNFRKKKPVTEGGIINTKVQEKGTTVIFNQVLHHDKKFNKPADIMKDKDTADKLKEVFKDYDESRINDWIHSYYEQQKEFLKKFSSNQWDEFKYGDESFVEFFEKHIRDKNVATTLKPLNPVKKYTEWNPADIWAAYKMDDIKEKIDENITPKTQKVAELNNLLIGLFKKKQLIGLSLKKIAPNQKAQLKFVNASPSTMKIAKIETYKMKDIEFVVDNIFEGDAIATTVKFEKGAYKIDIGHSGSRSAAGNLNFGTAIKSTPGARGGQAPVEFVIDLLKRKGKNITFKNKHGDYPITERDYLKQTSTFEKYYNTVKPEFKGRQTYDQFEKHIIDLLKDKKYIAQTKLMMLHFFHDALKNYSKNAEFWTDLLYLGLKVGKRFAPHAKIS